MYNRNKDSTRPIPKHSHLGNSDCSLEVINLAEQLPPVSYGDFSRDDYNKPHSLYKNLQKDRDFKLPEFKQSKFSYASGKLPDLSSIGNNSFKEDASDSTIDLQHISDSEDFPPPEELLKKDAPVEKVAGETLAFDSKVIGSPLQNKQYGSRYDITDLCSSISTNPRAQDEETGYDDDFFDFSAYDADELMDRKSVPGVEIVPKESGKRPRTPSSSSPMKKRPFKETLTEMVHPCHALPDWVNEFDPDLINELKDIVEFVD